MSATIIDGKSFAAEMRREIAAEATELTDKGWSPRLVSVSVGDTAAAQLYVRNQQRNAEAVGVEF